MGRLDGKLSLITAAAQGIGRATVEAFSREGAHVVATDINAAKLAELDGLPNVTTRVLNVLDNEAVKAAAMEIGRLDILFNCAGVVHGGTVLEMPDSDLEFAFDLNVWAQIRMIRAFMPAMLEHGDGCIINMSTVASSWKAVPNRAAYSISKAAVIGLTKSIAADYTSKGIRVNAIAPGTVESPSLHDRWKATGDIEAARKAFIARQPIGRIGQSEEVAELATYLATATYTTGQVHVIDGGWTA
ncbi:MAG: SDR family oxidoreductase [Devosia sp.]